MAWTADRKQAVAFYFIYRYSSNYRKLTFWLIPV
jgi:hypothetical protein